MTEWKVAYSPYAAAKPKELDTTSSPDEVYERKDFEVVTRKGFDEKEDIKEWKYLERTYTKDEYALISMTAEKVSIRHENDIRDEYMMELIEGGLI